MARQKKDLFHVRMGERIRTYRKQARLTQEQLAEKVGISSNAIGCLERGEHGTSTDRLNSIATALGVAAKDLLDFPDDDPDALTADSQQLLSIATEAQMQKLLTIIVTMAKNTRWKVNQLQSIRRILGELASW